MRIEDLEGAVKVTQWLLETHCLCGRVGQFSDLELDGLSLLYDAGVPPAEAAKLMPKERLDA